MYTEVSFKKHKMHPKAGNALEVSSRIKNTWSNLHLKKKEKRHWQNSQPGTSFTYRRVGEENRREAGRVKRLSAERRGGGSEWKGRADKERGNQRREEREKEIKACSYPGERYPLSDKPCKGSLP